MFPTFDRNLIRNLIVGIFLAKEKVFGWTAFLPDFAQKKKRQANAADLDKVIPSWGTVSFMDWKSNDQSQEERDEQQSKDYQIFWESWYKNYEEVRLQMLINLHHENNSIFFLSLLCLPQRLLVKKI